LLAPPLPFPNPLLLEPEPLGSVITLVVLVVTFVGCRAIAGNENLFDLFMISSLFLREGLGGWEKNFTEDRVDNGIASKYCSPTTLPEPTPSDSDDSGFSSIAESRSVDNEEGIPD